MAPEAGGEDPEKVSLVPRGVRQEVQPLTNTGRPEVGSGDRLTRLGGELRYIAGSGDYSVEGLRQPLDVLPGF